MSKPEEVTTACPAGLMIAGEYFACDWQSTGTDDGTHPGWNHANKKASALWCDDPAKTVRQ